MTWQIETTPRNRKESLLSANGVVARRGMKAAFGQMAEYANANLPIVFGWRPVICAEYIRNG